MTTRDKSQTLNNDPSVQFIEAATTTGQMTSRTRLQTGNKFTAAITDSEEKKRMTHVAYNPRLLPKNDELESYHQFWAIFNQKEEDNAIYFVSSVNQWLPIKLMDPEEFEGKNNKTSRLSNRRGSAMNRGTPKNADS